MLINVTLIKKTCTGSMAIAIARNAYPYAKKDDKTDNFDISKGHL